MKHLFGSVLVATLAVAALPAAASATPPRTSALPRVLTCAGKAVVRPTSYVLACADANASFTSIRWTSWTRASATASATYVRNNCAPTCAQGHFVTYPARLELSGPKQTNDGLLFSVIRYHYTVSVSSTLPLRPLPGTPQARARCSPDPVVAAKYVIPPPPFSVRAVAVQRIALPPAEPVGKGPNYKRLYRVRFFVLHGNAVLPAGHTYAQFAYVSRPSTSAPWCFLKGGSGP